MNRNFQTDSYYNEHEYTRVQQPDGSYYYVHKPHNRYKLAFKFLNYLGLTTYLFGILANINNLLSVLLAIVGIVWVVLKCLEKNEDWRLKKWERQQREKEYEERKKKSKRA